MLLDASHYVDIFVCSVFVLPDHQFIIKEYNLGKARWRRYTGQVTGMGAGAGWLHTLSIHPSPFLGAPLLQNLHVSINPEALQTPFFWVFMETSSHGHN